jgi:hypothetical protein
MKHSNPYQLVIDSNRCHHTTLFTEGYVKFEKKGFEPVKIEPQFFALVNESTIHEFSDYCNNVAGSNMYLRHEHNSLIFALRSPTVSNRTAWTIMLFVAEGENPQELIESYKLAVQPYIKNSADHLADLEQMGIRQREQMVIDSLPPELRNI